MRRPTAQKLSQLAKLTETRELAALAEFARLAARKRDIEAQIASLRSPLLAFEDPVQAANLALWQSWRDEEIRRLLSRLSLITAEMMETAELCGRAIAENAVMERLVHRTKVTEADTVEKKKAMQRALEQVLYPRSHLLADDLGDQDV